jgi:integrase
LAILVRDGKGGKQRVTTLAESCVPDLTRRLEQVELYWREDTRNPGWGGVYLPYALARKYPNAPFELAWHYLFPASKYSCDPRSGIIRRHHFYEQNLQRAVKRAVIACGINKQASCHTLRHSFATGHLSTRARR